MLALGAMVGASGASVGVLGATVLALGAMVGASGAHSRRRVQRMYRNAVEY